MAVGNEHDDVVALPAVEVDPSFVAAVEDAMSGLVADVGGPNRTLGADPHDFAGLYIRHRSSFAMHARRFLRDSRDVDEVVQEAFLRLFLALPELSTELQALAYCRRTVTNLCIDRYRADKRRPRLVNIESVPQNDFAETEHDDPVVQAEDAAFVREALSLLTPLHRDALVKREIEEKSIPVIALELGVPEESVKHLLHRARRALRRHLAKTHLAPGANLDDVSTLALLARSAAAGGGRAGVAVLFLIVCIVGVKPDLPATALTSWPLHDLLPAVGRALSPVPVQAPPTKPKPATHSSVRLQGTPSQAPDPVAPLGTGKVTTVKPRPSVNVAAVTKPDVTPAAKPSPESTPDGSPTPSPSASGSPSPSSSSSPSSSASPSGSPSASPTASPKASPTGVPRGAHAEVSPSGSPPAIPAE
ncbi:MAG: polymerase subunit sigma-24 [Frankiales bacterium]|nr:polymerase subunit sigma-24 [Frankiales bacterium]